ncbi:hypothetical protein E2C01_042861 [Portunus trituberculatus]|uniref:Uncharacterized protein n=1 Tax=Portunus trituberculatus TaxID=210409 RepID=A0A5B7FUR3_PORTR|nr:hypothetical protein [Portunus trituberculatus]
MSSPHRPSHLAYRRIAFSNITIDLPNQSPPRFPQSSPDFPNLPQASPDFSRLPQASPGFSRLPQTSLDFTRFSQALLSALPGHVLYGECERIPLSPASLSFVVKFPLINTC